MLAEYLAGDGFAVTAVHDGQAGVDALREVDPDAVVMDITMPVLDGFEALRQIRAMSGVPVLMLTARGDELDRIVGLEIGADDYLPKPFNPRELTARLRAVLRRTRAAASRVSDAEARFSVGDLSIEPGSQTLRCGGRRVPVTATEFTVIAILMRSAGQVVLKEALSERALGRRLTPFDRSLDTHISNLRRKLGPASDSAARIKTVRGRGYLLVTGSGRVDESS